MRIVFDEKGLEGIKTKWVFDEFFSTMIAGDYDANHNGKIENSEIRIIKSKAFSNLANFGYFTFIRIDGRPFKVTSVRDFSAALVGGRLTYEFFIPCNVEATSNFKEIRISQYDPTYYTKVAFSKEQPVTLEAGSSFEIRYRIAKNLKETYYFGQIHPVEVTLRFRTRYG